MKLSSIPRSIWAVAIIGGATIICAVAIVGCSSVRKIPVNGNFHGYSISTTVDDENAKYYLEDYLPGHIGDAHLHQRIGEVHKQFQNAVPSREQLKTISNEFSVDFAALFFANQLLSQKGNVPLQKQFLMNLNAVRRGIIKYPKSDVLIMFVPGYDYIANGRKTGADFAKPRKLLEQAGYDVIFVTIDPLGSVEENAAYLARSILSNRHRKIAVVGASSAGPAIQLALGKLIKPDDLTNVRAWLNLGGILQGSPVLDQFSSGPKGWLFPPSSGPRDGSAPALKACMLRQAGHALPPSQFRSTSPSTTIWGFLFRATSPILPATNI